MFSRSFSKIFVFCLAFLVGVRADPELTNVTVIEGQPLQLNCSFLSSAFDGQYINWQRGGAQGNPETLGTYLAGSAFATVPSQNRIIGYSGHSLNFTVHVDDNTTTFMLTLFNATSTDGRRYLCQKDGLHIYVTYAVDVHGPPRNVRVDFIHAVAEEGDRVQFGCRASGNPPPRLAWFDKNGNELPSSDGVANFTASVEVSGIITCRAENDYGQASNKTILAVRYKPRIAVANRWAVKLGMLLRLTCNITSVPASNGYWLKGGQVISESDPSYTLQKVLLRAPDDLSWQLVLKKTAALQQSDLGEYTCLANNSIGAAHRATLVTDLPFNSSIEVKDVGSTQTRLALVTFAVKPIYFILTISAVNSTVEPKNWRQHVRGSWPESAAATVHDVERRDGEATVTRVENNYCVQGLKPTSRYQFEMEVWAAHRVDEKHGNYAVRDPDTEPADVAATLLLETRAASSAFTCGDDRSSEGESDADGKQPERTRKLDGGRAAGVNSALSSLSMTTPMVWAIATWQSLVAAAR